MLQTKSKTNKTNKTNKIAIIDPEKCNPTKCSKECIRGCPPQSNGYKVIEIEDIGKVSGDVSSNISNNISNLTDKKQIAKIAENLCIGCNICTKKCPFGAIQIINLPYENPNDIVHRYGSNGFKLYGLPIMKTNAVIGIIGSNGVGKTTLIEILSDIIRPNFEKFDTDTSTADIIAKYRGSVLQTYLKSLYSNKLKFSIKFQKLKQHLLNYLKSKSNAKSNPKSNQQPELSVSSYIEQLGLDINFITNNLFFEKLGLGSIVSNNVYKLSGGEFQKLMCFLTYISNADVYIFDEPSNYLDVKQRLIVGAMIQDLKHTNKYVIVIEHDLSILDYMSDELYILYGVPGAYGIVSKPLTVLEGYISTQNIRFRSEEYDFKLIDDITNTDMVRTTSADTASIDTTIADSTSTDSTLTDTNHVELKITKPKTSRQKTTKPTESKQTEPAETESAKLVKNPEQPKPVLQINSSEIEFDNFKLIIPTQPYNLDSAINLILGENGTGKTTYIKYLAKSLGLNISIKDQHMDISSSIYKYNKNGSYLTVGEIFTKLIPESYVDIGFSHNVIKPLEIDQILNKELNNLSGGELQKVMIILCLGNKTADIYLIDEPSAHLDIDKRLKLTKIIRNHILNNKKCAFVIEHDIMMAVALSADINNRIIMIESDNSIQKRTSTVSEMMDFNTGINSFLKSLNITMRTSINNGRPRINKYQSQMDKVQKANNKYYGNI